MASCTDLLNGSGSIKDVVLSGAKGEMLHIDTYLKNLYHLNPNRKNDMIVNFNKYIVSGATMSLNGAYQFIFLEAVNPLTMLNGHVYYNDKILMKNVINSTAFASYCYNYIACEYAFLYIADTSDKVTEAEIDAYLNGL